MSPMKNVMDSFKTYLAYEDLDGMDRIVTIRDVNEELQPTRNDDDEEVNAPILYINEHKKGIRLNKTMANQLVDMFDKKADTTFWVGRRIIIYPTTERAFGQNWDVIRIRENLAPDDPVLLQQQQQGTAPAPAAGGFAGQPAEQPAQTAPQPAQTAPTAQPDPTPAAAQQNAPAPTEGGSEQPSAQPANALTREQAAANQQAAAPQEQPAQSSEWFG